MDIAAAGLIVKRADRFRRLTMPFDLRDAASLGVVANKPLYARTVAAAIHQVLLVKPEDSGTSSGFGGGRKNHTRSGGRAQSPIAQPAVRAGLLVPNGTSSSGWRVGAVYKRWCHGGRW